ncbi:hypothetical protein OPT61_g6499 [Boeremia exigua]|uniref:Uncharacterized protein n=1 Tax=Boeremia exigua TaxID=749465 RepID=A0ACC2I6E9_9PLEO|nr:hypothetical protein OPT61_g6499 [Boeremia exigua]
MHFNSFTAGAILAAVAAAAPTVTYPGPPVIYQTAPSAPLVTAVTLAAPVATAAAQRLKRDSTTCYPQPAGINHQSSPDTDSAFLADSYYSQAANAANTPLGFNSVFSNTQASPNAPGYLGFTLMDTYDVQTCADKCNAITGCTSFNVYFERDPSVDPNDPSCSNPPSVTNIKCVWWSSKISTSNNVNDGQYRGDFHVVIAGSNGYVGTPTQRGFRIRTDGSGTIMDNRWLAVSPGEGAAVALNPVAYKAQTSIFQFGPDGSLIQIAPKTGMAGVSPNKKGTWDFLQFRAIGENADYIKCSGDNLIVCTSASGYQYAGVCPGRKQSISGLLYFGLPQKTPKDCSWIGLYIDTDISGVAM